MGREPRQTRGMGSVPPRLSFLLMGFLLGAVVIAVRPLPETFFTVCIMRPRPKPA